MSRGCGAASTPGALEGTAIIGGGAPTSAWPGGTSARRGCMSIGAERVSASPGSIGASLGAGRLASTLASAARARASADVWPRGSFSATLVSVFVCLRGGNAFASFAALRAGCATGASVSCCGAGLCLLTAAAAGDRAVLDDVEKFGRQRRQNDPI